MLWTEWFCLPQNHTWNSLIPKCNGILRWILWEVISFYEANECGTLRMGLVPLKGENKFLFPSFSSSFLPSLPLPFSLCLPFPSLPSSSSLLSPPPSPLPPLPLFLLLSPCSTLPLYPSLPLLVHMWTHSEKVAINIPGRVPPGVKSASTWSRTSQPPELW